jgi:hypothetical protein
VGGGRAAGRDGVDRIARSAQAPAGRQGRAILCIGQQDAGPPMGFWRVWSRERHQPSACIRRYRWLDTARQELL